MKKIILIPLLALSLYAQNEIQIFKPVTSTCPQSWLDDIKKDLDEVKIVSLVDVKELKRQIGIPREIQSCNTSILNDYVFEGNVPSLAIKDFLKNTPKNAIGLSLPAYENDKEEKIVFIIFQDKTYKEFGKYH
ncbi:DUF411 domain-containing protein [Arcobacter caeni]|uniref:DUF411 domain-containing protein n=1 Tax=Arcobacter caeni TaxID=1912877 RepID=A0A363D3Z2_9BACT|nr:DUF411 domain-containing protein [Arcobacter caeni]PUE66024.1 hypothetical protein B0174_01785 [Arcobacter caeni]